jgi:ABC-type transporter MlaC component
MALVSALIVALQGTNIVQGVAISGTEQRIGAAEDKIENLQDDLLKEIKANQQAYMADFQNMKNKVDHIDDSIGKK